MAFVTNNDLTDGLSGKVGNKLVFRVLKGKTVASARPRQSSVVSASQIAHRERFQRAAQYAKAKMLDPQVKAEYEQYSKDNGFNGAFTVAVRDYLVAPRVLDVDVRNYSGAAGSVLPIKVSDNFKVIRLRVSIIDESGSVVETGEATYTPGNVEWMFTTTRVLSSLEGAKIVVIASDRPGNETTFEKVLV